jgi:hypothetical protein
MENRYCLSKQGAGGKTSTETGFLLHISSANFVTDAVVIPTECGTLCGRRAACIRDTEDFG